MCSKEDIQFQVLKDIILSELAFNKSALDFRILVFNERFKKIITRHKTIGERVRNLNETFELINSYIGISKVEKKMRGEVFTEFGLGEEILDKLPKEEWENLYSTALDPANGCGNFPVIYVQRCMYGFTHKDGWTTKGLSEIIPDEEERYKWILEKKLYVCDIQPKNMFIYLQIFDPENKYKMNYYTGSFLKNKDKNEDKFGDKMKEWNIKNFRLIMGNPPYNDSGGIKGGGNNLYVPFIERSLELLEKDGYLAFVTNAGWLKKTNLSKKTILNCVLELNLLYLNINECKKWFNVGGAMPFCYFLLRNNKNYTKTTVKSIDDNNNIYESSVNLKQIEWIPRIVTDDVYSIINKFSIKKFNFSRIDNYVNNGDPSIIGFKRLNHIVKPYKVNAVNDISGVSCIILKSDNLRSDFVFFNSNIFSFLNFIHRYDANIYHYMVIYFGYNGDLTDKSDDELYKYFNLTDSEIKIIEDTLK